MKWSNYQFTEYPFGIECLSCGHGVTGTRNYARVEHLESCEHRFDYNPPPEPVVTEIVESERTREIESSGSILAEGLCGLYDALNQQITRRVQ